MSRLSKIIQVGLGEGDNRKQGAVLHAMLALTGSSLSKAVPLA